MSKQTQRVTPRVTKADVERAHQDGFDAGLEKGRQEILDWLEHEYIHAENRPDRGTPKAEAIMELVAAASAHFRAKVTGKRGKKK